MTHSFLVNRRRRRRRCCRSQSVHTIAGRVVRQRRRRRGKHRPKKKSWVKIVNIYTTYNICIRLCIFSTNHLQERSDPSVIRVYFGLSFNQ